MIKRILVTYASRTGSTIGVAQAIAAVLTESGAQVDVVPMPEVKELSAYQAVVAGSPIQGGAWLPEAMEFMRIHKNALNQKPFAAFLTCMTLTMGNGKYRSHVATFLQPVRDLVKPRSEGLFAGALDISRIPSLADRIKFRLSVLFGVWREGDQRDWNAIRAWAATLPKVLS
ncbi:MAG: flavodoxin [Leptolinea sp.]|jgi:menaquinone-dependent protoporphyrinogen oxidase|nr:flavodoxin [Leptolinea sp.]